MKVYKVKTLINGFDGKVELTNSDHTNKKDAFKSLNNMGFKKTVSVQDIKRTEIYASLVLVENNCVNTTIAFYQ